MLASLIWDFFPSFDFPSRICCDFFRTALFLENLLRLNSNWHNSYFLGPAISSEQQLFEGSFFKQSLLGGSYFFQNSYFFRAKLLPKSHFLWIESSLGQLLFVTASFLAEVLFRIKISIEGQLFRSRYFCTASTFS